MDLAHALQKLEQVAHHHPLEGQPKHEATAHLFIVNPFSGSFLMKLFSTHPPMEERIAKLEDLSDLAELITQFNRGDDSLGGGRAKAVKKKAAAKDPPFS